MSGNEPHDGEADQTSFKPVSSLRKRFENLGSEPGSATDTQPLPRPRPLSHLSNPTDFTDQERTKDSFNTTRLKPSLKKPPAQLPANANPRKTPPKPLKPKPLLALPKSPDRPTPVVNIHSPKSPPPKLHIPSPTTWDITNASSRISQAWRMSSHSVEPDPPKSPFLDDSEAPDFFSNRPLSVASTIISPKPPLVNRSAKPTSSSIDTYQFPSSSKLPSRQSDVSPFASPPESEIDPSSPPAVPQQSKPQFNPPTAQVGLTATPQLSPILNRKKSSDQAISRPVVLPKQTIQLSHSMEANTPELRPSLPPRRDIRSSTASPALKLSTKSDQNKPSALTMGFSSRASAPASLVVDRGRATISSTNRQIATAQPRKVSYPASPSTEIVRSMKTTNPGLITRSNAHERTASISTSTTPSAAFPDSSKSNRRPPNFQHGPRFIATGNEARLFDVCGDLVCCSGIVTRVWNLLTGKMSLNMAHAEAVKITAVAFKPARKIDQEGTCLWLGTNWGEIQEIEISSKRLLASNIIAHNRREILRIYRRATDLYTLDDEGKLYIWKADSKGSPNLDTEAPFTRLPRGHTASKLVGNQLWLATGKIARVFELTQEQHEPVKQATSRPLTQPNTGDITSCTTVGNEPDRVYFGHADGKITAYSIKDFSCLEVLNISLHKVSCLTGVGDHLWAGFATGRICVYDAKTIPWTTKKDWAAHSLPVLSMIADSSSTWKIGRFQVISLGAESVIGVWDGMLESDWLDEDMHKHDVEYCTFNDISTLVMSWNAGATKPSNFRFEKDSIHFIRNFIQAETRPDILVFGFQELIDLEDKKLTAKSFFKSKTKDSYGQEQLGGVYRDWRDHLTHCLDEYSYDVGSYTLLHTGSMIGLFTCIFVESSLRARIKGLEATEVKTGMGGLHGNKGALVIRFTLDDSSMCFVNCHLAAGQTQTVNRNHDVATILDKEHLSAPRLSEAQSEIFTGGGDGSMIMDHEICVLNGDLNYRIDAIPRDNVVTAIKNSNLTKCLDRDQLSLSKRKNPGFRLRDFAEAPITFAPTYKYDVGTDNYDSSEKRRTPAWCDRILYRSTERVQQLGYQRHEVRLSDHRPVSGSFKMQIKTVNAEKRMRCWRKSAARFEELKERVANEAKLDYLTNVFGLDDREAQKLIE